MVRRLLSGAFVLSAVFFSAGTIAHAGAGGAAPSLTNGDVNGDGTLDLSDAVYIIQFLYLAGPNPEVAVCQGGTAGDIGKFRIGSDVFCAAAPVVATLTICNSSVSDTADATDFIPSDCIEVPVAPSCPVTVLVITDQCGAFEFCGDLPVAKDDVYSFVLTFDATAQLPAVGYFHQVLDASGACPEFPPPTVAFDGFLNLGCGAGGGGGVEGDGLDGGIWSAGN